jgi:hypothetical protein
MSDKKPSVVNFADYQSKENEERKSMLLERIEDLRTAIQEDRLTDFVMTWEAELENDPDDASHEAHMVFWNVQESLDMALSRVTRMQTRLSLMADGMIE